MDDIQSILLSELRAMREDFESLRDDLHAHTTQTADRLATLNTQMYSVIGNGKPGRLGVAEEAIESLKQWRWRMAGITTAVSTFISIAAWLLEH